MLNHNVTTIHTLIKSDPTVDDNIEAAIIKLCNTKTIKRRMGTIKEVSRIWQVSTKTARKYVKNFNIHYKKYSDRLIRYDLDEVEDINFGQ